MQIANKFHGQVLKLMISLITGVWLASDWSVSEFPQWLCGRDSKRCWHYSHVNGADVDHVTLSTASANEIAEWTVGLLFFKQSLNGIVLEHFIY